MDRRPKSGEDEEDILKMQEEFLRKKNAEGLKPAAKFVNLRNVQSTSSPSCSGNATRKPSKYAQAKGLTTHVENNEPDSPHVDSQHSMTIDSLEDKVNSIFNSSVLGNIIEKNTSIATDVPVRPVSIPAKGFPAVIKYDSNCIPGKKSIFAQHMGRQKSALDTPMDIESAIQPKQIKLQHLNLPERSFILTSANADSIHQENVETLGKLSENEILEEQHKLLSMLNPDMINFLKSKRGQTKQSNIEVERNIDMDVEEIKSSQTSINITDDLIQNNDESLWENDILSHPRVDDWVNFNKFERDKLEWMKGIQESKKLNGNEPYEARFDFNGYLLPYTLEYTEKNKVLFHHGEEPHRPGYSLIELFELSRSSIMQQRIMALNTIAGIMEYYSTGMYKDVIEIPLTKIFFIVRFALDENSVGLLEPALRAMRNIFFNRVDEASLDSLLGTDYGYTVPELEHDKSEITELESTESELKDFHLADIDLVTGLLRTDILQRLQYILNYVKPSFHCVQYSLQILTRLARDSEKTALSIVNCDHLISCIITNFVPITGSNFPFDVNNVYNGKPMLAAIKLIRVIILQSREAAVVVTEKYNTLDALFAYINTEVDSLHGLRIQMEALAALTNLVIQRVAIDRVCAFVPVLLTSLYRHVGNTDIHSATSDPSAIHAAVLLHLIRNLLTTDDLLVNTKIKSQVYPLLQQGFTKWISQVGSLKSSCSRLKLLSATIDCINMAFEIEGGSPSNQALENIIKNFISTAGFDVIFRQLIPSSNMLSKIKNYNLQLDKNLQTLCATVIDRKEKVLPILSPSSPILFLVSFVKLILNVIDPHCLKSSFLNNVWPYFSKLRDEVPSLCDNWFTRIEIDLLLKLLRIAELTGAEAHEMDTVYAIANKTCYVLRADQYLQLQYLFEKVIFEENSFTIDKLLKMLSIKDIQFPKDMKYIENIKLCYWNTIRASFVKSDLGRVCKNWREPILPRDWIYLPIVKLYSDHQIPTTCLIVSGVNSKYILEEEATRHQILISCLTWIILNERCFENLIADIDITDRFCRLTCIFLCDNSLFMNSEIKSLLRECIVTLFSKENQSAFDFNKDLAGINNFQDFYTQLLEQFQAVSYGDDNFAVCILVPIAQKHNVKWRKLLWSEYAACLRFIVAPEDRLCYNLNEYLFPEETDESLLESYLQALTTRMVLPGTVPYKIASHHVHSFRRRQSANDNAVKE